MVFSKAPFDGPEKVLDYLGRYAHRVAIASHRIVKVEDRLVTFQYRDRTNDDKCKQITISADEFIRRFLLHVIPDSYKRIRHFGFLANRCKKQDLLRCRELLGLCPGLPPIPAETMQEKMLRLTGVDLTVCPSCKQGRMRRVAELPISNHQRFSLGQMQSSGFEKHSHVVSNVKDVFEDEKSYKLLPKWKTAGRYGDAVGPENIAVVLDTTRYGPFSNASVKLRPPISPKGKKKK